MKIALFLAHFSYGKKKWMQNRKHLKMSLISKMQKATLKLRESRRSVIAG